MKLEDMNDSQKRKYTFFTRLKEDALNSKSFIESGLNFTKIQDNTYQTFGVGKAGCWLCVSFSIRKNKCNVSYYISKELYDTIYQKRYDLENDLGFTLKWTDPGLDKKQFTANYDIENVDFDDELQMKQVNNEIIEVLSKCKICIQKYFN